MTDQDLMQLAIAEARAAEDAGEVPIGAVIAYKNEIIARGQNRVLRDHDPTAHAEIVALRQAGQALQNYRLSPPPGEQEGCTLYVTLEPCAMCAGAAVLARVDRIVFGAFDSKAGAVGSLWDIPRDQRLNHRPEVVAGVLAVEARELLDYFFASHRAVG